jgi:hypothetical protein
MGKGPALICFGTDDDCEGCLLLLRNTYNELGSATPTARYTGQKQQLKLAGAL